MPSIMTLFAPPPPIRAGLVPVPATPGAMVANWTKLRLEMGRFWTASVLTVKDRSPLPNCTTGDSAVTRMVSASAPTSIVSVPMTMRSPGLTLTPDRFIVLKPSMVTWTM